MSSKMTFDMFLHPHILKALQKRGQLNIIRIYTDELEQGKKKSRFGYEGDTWYILESGRFYDFNENIFIFQDNTAKKKSGNIGIDIIAPCLYEDASGEKIPASRIPKWAARTWVEIQGVSYPKKVQDITESEIMTLGFDRIEGDMPTYSIGDYTFSTNNGLKYIFQQWWDEFMGGWRVIKKHGIPHEYLAYPYKNESTIKEIAFEPLPRKTVPNPYVMVYTVKII
jgi:hypothetical protein